MNRNMTEPVAALWQAFIDGDLTPAQAVELEQSLQADSTLAALAAEYYIEHRLLS
jgi:anti-sigma factor RsiW